MDETLDPDETTQDFGTDPSLKAISGRYEILAEAGRGGMGTVYKAKDRETGDTVAIKLLHADISNQRDLINELKGELLVARKITHRNVCRVHDLNRFGTVTAISMEFVEGESLRSVLLRSQGMSVRRGLEVSNQIISGLKEAHAQGVVHRDLKPENIMIAADGTVKIMDFGLARVVDSAQTVSGNISGTPAYMSPEQAEGKAADSRSDIYSLGLTLYEMFTGQRAFEAESPVAMLHKHVHDLPPSPHSIEPHLPDSIDSAIQKCIEKNPQKRYQNMDALHTALTSRPQVSMPTADDEIPIPAHLATWQRSDWVLLSSAMAGAVLFFVLFYQFHPASAAEMTVGGAQVEQIASDLAQTLGWEIESLSASEFRFDGALYYYGLAPASIVTAHGFLADKQSLGSWGVSGTLTGGQRIRFDLDGKGRPMGVQRAGGIFEALRGLGSTGDRLRLCRDACNGRRSGQQPLWIRRFEFGTKCPVFEELNFVRLQWMVADESGLLMDVGVLIEGSTGVVFATNLLAGTLENPSDPSWIRFTRPFMVAGVLMWGLSFFISLLFFVRRMYREPRSTETLRFALLVGTLFVVTGVLIYGSTDVLTLISLLLSWIVVLLLTYAVCYAITYYLRKRLPSQIAGYLKLFREGWNAQAAGLELLRGILAGMVFVGSWFVLMIVLGIITDAKFGMVAIAELFFDFSGFTGVPYSPSVPCFSGPHLRTLQNLKCFPSCL